VLPIPSSSTEGFATDVNNHNVVVGNASSVTGVDALQWSNDGTPTLLAGLSGSTVNHALVINDNGMIAGDSFSGDGHQHAVVWQ